MAVLGLHTIHGDAGFAEIQEHDLMSYEKIFEYDLDIKGVTDYGANMEALFAGQESVPLQGAQFDVALAGLVKGRVTAPCEASTIFGCVPTAAANSSCGAASKRRTGVGSQSRPKASGPLATASQSSIWLLESTS